MASGQPLCTYHSYSAVSTWHNLLSLPSFNDDDDQKKKSYNSLTIGELTFHVEATAVISLFFHFLFSRTHLLNFVSTTLQHLSGTGLPVSLYCFGEPLPGRAAMYNEEAVSASGSLESSRVRPSAMCVCLKSCERVYRGSQDLGRCESKAQQFNLFSPGCPGNGDQTPTWKTSISWGRQENLVQDLDTDPPVFWAQLCHLIVEWVLVSYLCIQVPHLQNENIPTSLFVW